jgi:pyridoxal phosphate enzyme (YggS family)
MQGKIGIPFMGPYTKKMSIESNLARLKNQIADACARAHRDPATVALMAVSKTHPAEAILEAYHAGQRLFGENRVQEWQGKRETLTSLFGGSDVATMHLIGPLQNNKTGKAAELFDAVDSLDSLKTAERLNAAAAALGKKLDIYIEVKLSPEESKHGLSPDQLPMLLTALSPLKQLRTIGLMTVPPLDIDPRPTFQQLRRLRDESLQACPTLTGLSMGMSNDFALAIEEGSTLVRVGTAIFGSRTYA